MGLIRSLGNRILLDLEIALIDRQYLVAIAHRDVSRDQFPAVEWSTALDPVSGAAVDQPVCPIIEAGNSAERQPELRGRLARVAALVLVLVDTAGDGLCSLAIPDLGRPVVQVWITLSPRTL